MGVNEVDDLLRLSSRLDDCVLIVEAPRQNVLAQYVRWECDEVLGYRLTLYLRLLIWYSVSVLIY